MGSVAYTVLLPLLAAGIRTVGFRRVGRLLVAVGRGRRRPGEEPRQLARRVEAAGRLSPYRSRCLERALLLWWLLWRRGIEARLRVGVRREESALRAHAWVELDGLPLETPSTGSPPHEPFEQDFAPGRPHG